MAINTIKKVDTPYKNSWADRKTKGTIKIPEHPPPFSFTFQREYTMIFMGGKSEQRI